MAAFPTGAPNSRQSSGDMRLQSISSSAIVLVNSSADETISHLLVLSSSPMILAEALILRTS